MVVRELITKLGFQVDNAPLKRYEAAMQNLKGNAAGLSRTLGGVGSMVKFALTGAAAAGITSLGKSILDTTGEVERYRVTLGTMIGDQEKANRLIHELDYSPVSDFYGTAAAIGGLQGMVTFGMDAEKASDTLSRLGDIAQGSTEAFKSLSLNMGQVFAKGKADATDIKQFVQQGFDVVGETARITGKSREEIEKAGVSYEMCAKALVSVTNAGGKYNGMLAKQSATIPGLIKQFQSLNAAIKESIGNSVSGRVKGLMQDILGIVRRFQDTIVRVGEKLFNGVIDAIVNVIGWTEVLAMRTNNFKGFRNLFGQVARFFAFLGRAAMQAAVFLIPIFDKIAGKIADAFGWVFDFIGRHKRVFIELGKIALAVFLGIQAAMTGMRIAGKIMAIKDAAKALFGLFTANPMMLALLAVVIAAVLVVTHLKEIKEWWGKLSPEMQTIIEVIGGVVGAILGIVVAIKAVTTAIGIAKAVMLIFNIVCAANPLILIIMAIIVAVALLAVGIYQLVKHWDAVKAAFKRFGDWCRGFFISLVEKIKSIWNKIKDFFRGLWEGITAIVAAVVGKIELLWTRAVEWVKEVWGGIKDFFAGIVEKIKEVWGGIKEWFSNLWGGAVEGTKNAWGGITEWFGNLWEGIKSGVQSFSDGVKQFMEDPVGSIKQAYNSLGEFIRGVCEGIVSKFSWVGDKITALWDKIGGIWDSIREFFGWGGGSVDVDAGSGAAGSASAGAAGGAAAAARPPIVNNNDTSVNANNRFEIVVPEGTGEEQARAIAEQVEAQVRAQMERVFEEARAGIPTPEARRE